MHHHYFVESQDKLLDIEGTEILIGNSPTPPEGYEVARVDVIVRLRQNADNKTGTSRTMSEFRSEQ